MKFPGKPNTLFGLDTGVAFLTPLKDYGVPMEPTDMGEVEVTYTIDRTFNERRSNRSRLRPVVLRRLDQTTFTFSMKVFQEDALARLLKNVGKTTGIEQAAVPAGVIPPRATGMKQGTAIFLPQVATYDVAPTIGGQPASLEEDFFVQGPAGIIWARRDIVGAVAGTYKALETIIPRQKIGELEEVLMRLDIVKDAPGDVRGTRKTIPVIGFTPSEAIGEITGSSGADDGGFTVTGTVYDGGDGFGYEDGLMSEDEFAEAVQAALGGAAVQSIDDEDEDPAA